MGKNIKQFVPPVLLTVYRKIVFKRYGFFGNYNSWRDAEKECKGYDNEVILDAVRSSCLKVKNGQAIYERDSVLFDKIEYSWAVLAGLMYSCAKLSERDDTLRVCDFGGSLGSSYFQNIKFLSKIQKLSWSIIEQEKFVDIGRAEFEDERLKFFYNIDTCVQKQKPNVLLCSSTLQYIEKPYDLLDSILKYNFDFIIIDRTPFAKKDIIKKQIVPPCIYEADYPCRFLGKDKFLQYVKDKSYRVLEEFDCSDGSLFKGMILEKMC